MESRKILAEDLNKIFHVLERLIVFHRDLVDVIQQEYLDMTNIDVKGMYECAQTKETLLNEIYNFEKLRLTTLDRIIENYKLEKDSTLLDLCKYLDDDSSKKIKIKRSNLKELVEFAKNLNERNMIFVNESIERIDQMKKNILGLGNNTKENYSQGGIRHPMPEQGGRFLTTEA